MTDYIDNITVKFSDILSSELKYFYKADFCVGFFTLGGWDKIKQHFPTRYNWESSCDCRILVGKPQSNYRTLIDQLTTVESRNDEKLLTSLKEALRSGGLKIKYSPRKSIHSKVYIIRKDSTLVERYEDKPESFYYDIAFLGSSNLTYYGLVHNIELNKKITSKPEIIQLQAWFDELWKEPTLIDISEELAWSDLKYNSTVIDFALLGAFLEESSLSYLVGDKGEIYEIPEPYLYDKKGLESLNPGFEEVVSELISHVGLEHLHIPENPEEGRWIDEAPDWFGMSLYQIAMFCQRNPDYWYDKFMSDLMQSYMRSNYD
ncbi:MAG TPA: phospholipase D-like domain-containing protein [Allocoleopsis sp.]